MNGDREIADWADSAATLAALHRRSAMDAWSPEAWLSTLAQPATVCLSSAQAGVTEGFIAFAHVCDEAEILMLAVDPEFRRTGAASCLLEAAITRAVALGATRMYLDVAADNKAALALYAATGFGETGRRLGYYSRGSDSRVDSILMSRGLVGTDAL